jgi:hypothetical protein
MLHGDARTETASSEQDQPNPKCHDLTTLVLIGRADSVVREGGGLPAAQARGAALFGNRPTCRAFLTRSGFEGFRRR